MSPIVLPTSRPFVCAGTARVRERAFRPVAARATGGGPVGRCAVAVGGRYGAGWGGVAG